MSSVEGTPRGFERDLPQFPPFFEYMNQAAASVQVVVDSPLAGTLPVYSIDQEMLEGYQACAAMELEILGEFEAVDRENF
jgi:hypothetical protein